MRNLRRFVVALIAMGAIVILGAGAAGALTLNFTGTLSDEDPTMPVVFIVPPNCTGPGATPVHYDVIEFPHRVPGTYTFEVTSTGNTGTDAFASVYLYEGSFDPANGFENCVAADNGAAPIEITYDFLPNTPYFLVVFDDTLAQEGGDYEVVVEAPDPPSDTVGLVDPATGTWYLRDQAGVVSPFIYGNPGDVPFMGDWDCDGIDTPGLFRLSDAFAYLRNSNSQGIADIRFFFGNPSDIPLAGDFDGDGCDTLSLYRPEQRFYIINQLGANNGGLGPAEFSFLFGNPGDKPFVGDFDGDAIDEVGLHRESTGFVYYRETLTTGIADNAFFFGDPGDRFVTGDWGVLDYVDTPAVFRPANSTFFFRYSNSQGNADQQFAFGQPSWLPVSGVFEPGPATMSLGAQGGAADAGAGGAAEPDDPSAP